VQLIDDNALLQINELEIIKTSEGSKIGCTCGGLINPNGYGQCKKPTSYQHIKGQHVCYVTQPSNCTDLAFSTTNPGEKFSAEACKMGDAKKDRKPETKPEEPNRSG
jgi:hypothetical protein